MSKSEFISRLDYLLAGIPEQDKKEAIEYYINYFEDAGIENEERVIRELESPEKVAEQILSDFSYVGSKTTAPKGEKVYRSFWDEHRGISIAILIVIALLTSPVWGSVLGTLAGIVCSIFGVFLAIAILSMLGIAGGIICAFSSITLAFQSSPLFLLMLGMGLLLIAMGILCLLATIWIGWRFFPWVIGIISNLFHRIFPGKEVTRNEKNN